MVEFRHPLARDSKVWPSAGISNPVRNMLLIVTTLSLDESHGRYKKDKVESLRKAARAWITETKAADDFVLVNRPKDWT